MGQATRPTCAGPIGCRAKVRLVTAPKLPPPPRSAQNRSGFSPAEADTTSASAVTISAASRLSQLSPNTRCSQPVPPPSVEPAAPTLGARLRVGLRAPAGLAEDGGEPGTIILDRDLGLVAATGAAWRWIDRLGLQRPSDHEPLPGFVYAAVIRIAASPYQPQAPIVVRLQTTDRRWIVARVAPVTDSPRLAGGFVVTFEPARTSDLAPLLMRAWGLSARERDVAALAIGGIPSRDIAAALFISPH